MFHTYVLTAAKDPRWGAKSVDFDRAMYLMDKDLLQDALDALEKERKSDTDNPIRCTSDAAQFVWDYYCQRHYEKFGESFTPDVDPHWDT